MDLDLRGKVAVVTGASRGIGRATVDLLLAEGCAVVAGARDVSSLTGIGSVTPVRVDLSTPDGPAKLVEAALAEHGGLDFLVNNIGAARLHPDGFESIGDEDWQWHFETNFLSAVRAIRAALPSLRERRGAVVTVSSLNGKIPATEAPEYSAMKAALLNLSRSLAMELAPSGVRFNVVTPGPVHTDMQTGPGGVADQLGIAPGELVQSVEQSVPFGRLATPREIANVIVALLSPITGYVSGADYAVDGVVQGG